jgi:hypothetical protein
MERSDGFPAQVSIFNHVAARDAAGNLPRGLDGAQIRTLELVSLCLASVSVASSLLAFYWFIRIRRSFRHE